MEFQQALELHRQGRADEAARAYELVLLAEPEHLDALIHLGVLRLGQGRAGEAETLLRQAISASPASPEAHANLAAALQALGGHEEAVTHYARALVLKPDMLDARFGLAACLQASGRHEGAVASYEAILAADPAHPEANYGLATALTHLGRTDEAAAKYRAALAADPDFAEAGFGLGNLFVRSDDREAAIGCFRRALDVDPDYTEARLALGTTLSSLERDDEAISELSAVLASEPDNPDARVGVAMSLDRQRRYAAAIGHYRAALAHDPDHADAMGGMASTLLKIGEHAEALPLARRVAVLRPDYPQAAGLLGSVLAELGSMDEALEQFRHAVALAPGRPEFWYYLVQMGKVRPGDDAIHALEAALPNIAALSPKEQCLLHFALAKAYDDVGDRERGFAHLLQGNAIKRAQTRYEEAATLAAMQRNLPRVFAHELMADRKDLGDPSEVPVFIVGMPRSGTTLVEQMLASHAAVYGAGERTEMSEAIMRLSAGRIGAAAFPEAVWTMAGNEFRQIGEEYVASLRRLAPEAAHIVDKMPANFLYVGLIHLVLPNARIIHTVRDPVDTCLSCFSKLFSGEQAFCYDLGELGRYHRAYQHLMAHWRAVLPEGVMLEVEDQAVVDDFEAQARRIVAHCGLDWDPACLEFYKTSRPVHTASMLQVRQPIYRSSVGRWRPDPALLRPLLEALDGP